MTVQHLLPVLEQRCEWPERGRQVLAVGTRSEVPLGHRSPKQPLIQPVEPGTIVLGHELHQSLGIAVGDTVVFRGRELKVVRCHEQRGSKDDITVWINLGEAQELFEKPGSINGILALSCFCEGPRLERIRKEIASILPGTQVIERASQAIARAEARAKAAEVRADAVAAEKAYRERRRGEFETWAAVLVAVVAVGAFVWIGFLALANVRERRGEIGILRALGLGSGAVLAAVLVRSALVGLAGAAVGFGGGLLVGGAAVGSPGLFALLLLGAPLFSAAAGWLPAVAAARQDPAVVLRDE
jgi:ABC-type lipoprotein release transport system permease subunit